MEYFDGEPLSHVGDLPAMAAHRYGDKTAARFYDQELTFANLESRANGVAHVLSERGTEPGERIGLYIPNSLQYLESYFGIIKAGAVPVPLNLRMAPNTLEYVLRNANVDQMIGSALLAGGLDTEEGRVIGPLELAERADVGSLYVDGVEGDPVIEYGPAIEAAPPTFDRPDRDFDDVALQPYTSGTTGQPKGVLLTHENLLKTIEAYDTGGLTVDPDSTILLVLPLFHIYGLNAVVGTYVYKGAEMILQPRPEPVAMLDAIDTHDVTDFAGVPAIYTMMWREYRENPDAYDLSSLESVVCAAAPLADEVRRTIEAEWNVPMTEGWGMTETSPAGTSEPSRGVRKAAGCIGPPLNNVEIKLVDPETRETKVAPDQLEPYVDPDLDTENPDSVTGEIAIRGPTVFQGYYEMPEKTQAVFDDEGFFYTEDIARVDEDGYFWMVDRADDMIISGGENIYPAEVEDALYEHPEVAEAAVVAASHELKGEAPVAFVVLEEGSDLDEEELRSFSLDHVATYAHPRRIFFIDELPRSATQKVQRYKLEAEVAERLDGDLESSEEL
ncbi:MAG: class I adenylate-forming enzyme family protein [Natronomonas sp.]